MRELTFSRGEPVLKVYVLLAKLWPKSFLYGTPSQTTGPANPYCVLLGFPALLHQWEQGGGITRKWLPSWVSSTDNHKMAALEVWDLPNVDRFQAKPLVMMEATVSKSVFSAKSTERQNTHLLEIARLPGPSADQWSSWPSTAYSV